MTATCPTCGHDLTGEQAWRASVRGPITSPSLKVALMRVAQALLLDPGSAAEGIVLAAGAHVAGIVDDYGGSRLEDTPRESPPQLLWLAAEQIVLAQLEDTGALRHLREAESLLFAAWLQLREDT